MKNDLPYVPLMLEHRLIERMVKAISKEVKLMKRKNDVNPVLIDTIADFLRMYADRCHHGKEEEILFRALEKKDLSEEHKKIMDKLIDEHILARKLTATLTDANVKYVKGDKSVLPVIIQCMENLSQLYPQHIQTEDHEFFLPAMEYFTEDEKADLVKAEYDFDRRFLHQKYELLVLQAEKFPI